MIRQLHNKATDQRLFQKMKKILISAAISRFSGQLFKFNFKKKKVRVIDALCRQFHH